MDFWSASRLRVGMDDDAARLFSALCTRVGIIMEDTSIAALTLGSAAPADRAEGLIHVERAADQISKLVAAARALSVTTTMGGDG